jgi:protein-tyrosine-phosphatase
MKALKLFAVFTALTISSFAQTKVQLNKDLKKYIANVTAEFNQISDERKKILTELGDFILEDKQKHNKVNLTFICTSNSRRSHLSQLWMQTASIYYGVDSIITFSGGTEATEVNVRAVNALKRTGFSISRPANTLNSPYFVNVGSGTDNWMIYSKKYDNFQNPKSNFIAVMVCSEADKSCPTVEGANGRVGLPFEDPKYYDNTPSEEQKYDETCRLIARELLFVADYVKTKLILKIESTKK